MTKLSNYNIFIDNENLIFNTRTKALVTVNKDQLKQIKSNTIVDKELYEDSLEAGFILGKNISEEKLILRNRKKEWSLNNTLGLTIATTLKCNFKCPYCYEQGGVAGELTMEQMEEILNLVKNQLDLIKRLSITWYGGEPLLGIKAIEYLSEKLIDMCDENDVSYEAGVITNGYYLTPDLVDRLVNKYRVTFFQITLDGPSEIHDKTRILHNGEGTFEKILSNIKKSKDNLKDARISIRMNIDKNNYKSAKDLHDFLKDKDIYNNYNMDFHIAKIDLGEDNIDDGSILTLEEFSKIKEEFNKYIGNSKDRNGVDYNRMLEELHPKNTYCGADRLNSFVISPEGYLYKCWEDVGYPEHSIGRLDSKGEISSKEDILFKENIIFYEEYNPFEDDLCKNCIYLPLCMGGCPKEIKTSGKRKCPELTVDFNNKLIGLSGHLTSIKTKKV